MVLQTNLNVQPCPQRCVWTTLKGYKVNNEKFPSLWPQRKGRGSLFINDPIKRRKLCGVISRADHVGAQRTAVPGWGHRDRGSSVLQPLFPFRTLPAPSRQPRERAFVESQPGSRWDGSGVRLCSSASPNVDSHKSVIFLLAPNEMTPHCLSG